MKKTLLAGLFGFATVVSSYGNGTIIFDNYNAYPYMPIEYFSNHVGVADSNYHVDLLCALGTQSTTAGMTGLNLSVAINPSIYDGFGNHGYFEGGAVTIPGYVSGPVSFAVECWDTFGGTVPTFGLSDLNHSGISAVWQESSIATGLQVPQPFAGLPGPNGAPLLLVGVPEPSLLALSSIGAAALFLTRRRALTAFGKDV